MNDFTRILSAIEQGEPQAAERLLGDHGKIIRPLEFCTSLVRDST
jgi:hypothetical protein